MKTIEITEEKEGWDTFISRFREANFLEKRTTCSKEKLHLQSLHL